MFGAPEPQSPEELRAQEAEANRTLQVVLASGVALYFSPFVVDFVRKLF